jgi:hypothetical protein
MTVLLERKSRGWHSELVKAAVSIMSPDVRYDGFLSKEQKKLRSDLLKKYQAELDQAGWWKKVFLRWKICREVAHTVRGRLYLAVAPLKLQPSSAASS